MMTATTVLSFALMNPLILSNFLLIIIFYQSFVIDNYFSCKIGASTVINIFFYFISFLKSFKLPTQKYIRLKKIFFKVQDVRRSMLEASHELYV